jgi:TRAP transporter 4TM/12TM fusion protein
MDASARSAQDWDRVLNRIISGVAIVMIAYHAFTTWRPLLNDLMHQNVHLGFALVILFLVNMRSSAGRKRTGYLVAVVLSIGCVVYMHFNFERLDMWSGYPEPRDIPVGIILPVIVLVVAWLQWGGIITSLAIAAVLYALFGHLIPGALGHAEMRPQYVMSLMGVGYRGIYGILLNASAIIIMPFIIFGSTFESVGINNVFIEIGGWIGNRLRGGAAQIAVFSSSFVAMCTGAAMANVALTGAYTIPLMKDAGYRPEQAGAIEAVASTGGQITPPVMGVSVFIMASFLGISYDVLMIKAIPPAIIYFAVSALGVILIAGREDIRKTVFQIKPMVIVKGIWVFVIPMTAVVLLLLNKFSPAYAAYISLVILLAVSLVQKATRPTLGQLIDGLTKGAHIVASIAIVCAAVGIFIRMMIATGVGIKLAGLIETLSSGHLIIALVLTMFLSILMGCALPTVPAYAIVALVVAPALVNMGVERLLAHFFVFYYAVLAVITPPVAPGAMVASKMAGASFWKTGLESTRLAAPFFLVPYFIMRNPLLLLEPQKEPLGMLLAVIGIIIACASLMVTLQNFCLVRVSPVERVLFAVTAGSATVFGYYGGMPPFVIALVLFTGLILFQFKKRKPEIIQDEL